jgi:hypothetical protein
LQELKRFGDAIEANGKEITEARIEFLKSLQDVKTEIAMLKVKAGVWGLAAGAIPPSLVLIVYFVRTLMTK